MPLNFQRTSHRKWAVFEKGSHIGYVEQEEGGGLWQAHGIGQKFSNRNAAAKALVMKKRYAAR